MEPEIIELSKRFPQMSLMVQASDLIAFGKAIVSETMAVYQTEMAEREKADKEEKMLSAQEAGNILGVTPKTLFRWRKAGYIEGVCIGGSIKYRRSDCRAILANRRAR